jgi:molybdopterin/thiamine biosynthesis adenylyltransferase
MKRLSNNELIRYARQVIMPAIGEDGQEKIKRAKIFIAGIGGLGSISSYYLAAAGIGCLKIVDRDNVDISNLNRQIIHSTQDIGSPKTSSAETKLRALNPHVRIEAIQQEISAENIMDIVSDCSIIVDATDNMETRKALNIASVKMKIPFIYGGVDGFNGMVTTFIPGETPCIHCIFPYEIKKRGTIGVIGPAPGVVASLQTMEALKIILGMKGLLKGRLLYFSGVEMSFREIKIEKNPDCTVCRDWSAQ